MEKEIDVYTWYTFSKHGPGPPGWNPVEPGGGFKEIFDFHPNPGEMIQFDLRIFFNWVGSTTN